MAFSVTKSLPFRSLGFYKSTGKHAAPKGWVPEPRPAAEASAHPHRPAHAATMPRLAGSHAGTGQHAGTDRHVDTNGYVDTDGHVDTGERAA